MLKLSEIKGEKAFDVLADLTEPIANIAADKKAAELFGVRDLPDGMTIAEFVIHRLKTAVPALMRGHKDDIVTILATLSDVSREEYFESLTLPKVINDFSDLMTDPIFNAFFTTPQSTGKSSGSASENIAE